MGDFTPTPTLYADPYAVKRVLGKPEADAAALPVLEQLVADATALVTDRTGRTWCVDPDAGPVTLAYDAPYSSVLYIDDMADVTGVVVKIGAVTVDPDDYTWLYRTVTGGQYRHAYALHLHTGTWADDALSAERSTLGDVTLENAVPATTATPPSLVVQAVERIAVGFYDQRKAHYQHVSTGSEDIGVVPPPDGVVNADALAVLGPFIAPARRVGRP